MEISGSGNQFYMICSNMPGVINDGKTTLTPFSNEDLQRMSKGDYACGKMEKADKVQVQGRNFGEDVLAKLKDNPELGNGENLQVCRYSLDDIVAEMLLKRQLGTM